VGGCARAGVPQNGGAELAEHSCDEVMSNKKKGNK